MKTSPKLSLKRICYCMLILSPFYLSDFVFCFLLQSLFPPVLTCAGNLLVGLFVKFWWALGGVGAVVTELRDLGFSVTHNPKPSIFEELLTKQDIVGWWTRQQAVVGQRSEAEFCFSGVTGHGANTETMSQVRTGHWEGVGSQEWNHKLSRHFPGGHCELAAEMPLQWVFINQWGDGAAERAELCSVQPWALGSSTEGAQSEDVERPHTWRDPSITCALPEGLEWPLLTLGPSCSVADWHLYHIFFIFNQRNSSQDRSLRVLGEGVSCVGQGLPWEDWTIQFRYISLEESKGIGSFLT